jgi:hypothetical protein
MNVAARSSVVMGARTIWFAVIPGPAQMRGTDIADCQGLLFAVVA